MQEINLIPAARQLTKARRRRIVQWSAALALYGALWLAGYLVCGRYAYADTRPLNNESRQAAASLETSSRTLAALSAELAAANRKLQVAQAVGQQPDWGNLLVLLSQRMNNQLVLDSCRLRRVEIERKLPKGAAAPPRSQLLLEVGGLAPTQADVSAFTMSLERTGLFDKVKLVRTTRHTAQKGMAVAFLVECVFEAEGANP